MLIKKALSQLALYLLIGILCTMGNSLFSGMMRIADYKFIDNGNFKILMFAILSAFVGVKFSKLNNSIFNSIIEFFINSILFIIASALLTYYVWKLPYFSKFYTQIMLYVLCYLINLLSSFNYGDKLR